MCQLSAMPANPGMVANYTQLQLRRIKLTKPIKQVFGCIRLSTMQKSMDQLPTMLKLPGQERLLNVFAGSRPHDSFTSNLQQYELSDHSGSALSILRFERSSTESDRSSNVPTMEAWGGGGQIRFWKHEGATAWIETLPWSD